MTTRAIVPNADGEGSIGVDTLKWGAMYVNTPDTGANDESVPTTAWVQKIVAAAVEATKEALYPVGSIFMSLTDSRNPSEIFGFGTWEALPAGYGLVAQGTATAEDGSKLTFTAGQKSGEFKHQLTVGELPKIKPSSADHLWNAGNDGTGNNNTVNWSNHGSFNIFGVFNSFGNDEYHNNVSPVMAVYLWKRTA